jgi:hypothetical protein
LIVGLLGCALAAKPVVVRAEPGDPPAVVGRLAQSEGAVSFRPPSGTDWQAAVANQPVYAGVALWTEPSGHAVLDFPSARLALEGGTELDIKQPDARALAFSEPRGDLYVRLDRHRGAAEADTVETPRGVVHLTAPGRYGVDAGDADHPTTITVIAGSARIVGDGFAVQVEADHTATVNGAGPFSVGVGPRRDDPFLTAQMQADHPSPPPAALPPVVYGMTGAAELAAYGQWQDSSESGPVWFPEVPVGWAPYREGAWRWVPPWGWTWVDAAPWGFAPFHYGRWLRLHDRWAWTPCERAEEAVTAPPVYSPALVSFFAAGAGAALGAAAAMGHGGQEVG